MSRSLFLARALVIILFLSSTIAQATAADDQCSNPSTVFDTKLRAQLDSFRSWFIPTSLPEKDVELYEKVLASYEQQICMGLTRGLFDSSQAIKGLHTLKRWSHICNPEGGVSNSVKDYSTSYDSAYTDLYMDSVKHFCRTISQLPKRDDGIAIFFFEEAIQASKKVDEELICEVGTLFDLPDYLDFLNDMFSDFPPNVEFRSTLDQLCEEARKGNIDVEDAFRELNRAEIKYDPYSMETFIALIFHSLKKSFGPLAKIVIITLILSLVVIAISLPLWILSTIVVWLSSSSYTIWDDLKEHSVTWMQVPAVILGVLCFISFLLNIFPFLQVVAAIVGIIGTIIGALVGLKKLASRREGE